MKRTTTIFLLLAILATVGASAQEAYDSSVTVTIMRANAQAFGKLRAAASAGDFLAAAGALAVIADGSFTLLGYSAPQESDEDWARLHTGMVKAGLMGIIACGQEDGEGLSEAIAIIGASMREGHGEFR